MTLEHKINRLRVFIMLRLFIVTFLLFMTQVVFETDNLIFYYIIAFVCFLSIFYLGWLVTGRHLLLLTWTQIVVDILLETILVLYTDGIDSSFATIYVLSIISAGILIVPWASFAVAAFCSFLFSVIATAIHWGMIQKILLVAGPVASAAHDPLYLFYAIYVRITIFVVVAVLTNYLTGTILKLEEKIRIQKRLAFLGDVTSSIAHEIRNPLMAISSSVEVLAHDLKDLVKGETRQLMNAVVDESERLKRVFSQMLNYSKIEDLKLQETSVQKLLDHVLLVVSHDKNLSREVTIQKQYPDKQIQIEIDAEQMTDVFSNLIRNAYEAMPTGGKLHIRVRENRNLVEVVIGDTGHGMDKRTLKSLFLPFKTTKSSGTGLGLAQVQKIVALHEGKIHVSSQKGKGTQVTLYLKKESD